jgi:hypothetical protein
VSKHSLVILRQMNDIPCSSDVQHGSRCG